jgi:hypothetical protein
VQCTESGHAKELQAGRQRAQRRQGQPFEFDMTEGDRSASSPRAKFSVATDIVYYRKGAN